MAAMHHRVVIVGGGAGGISAAASLLRRRPGLDIAIIEPAGEHYYQPGWTLVGGGVFKVAQTRRPMANVMPKGVTWIRAGVSGFDPHNNAVILPDQRRVGYDLLVVATGNRLAWEEIEGIEQTLGQNGVTSNYRHDLAPYTWQLVEQVRAGRALFTQPPMPIKCAGAPQKAMYLACSAWERERRLNAFDVQFHTAGAVLFGVPEYVPALQQTVDRYGIGVNLGSNLVAVDGPGQKATFRTVEGERTLDFDMLHVCPPQKGNPVVAASALADAVGYAEVDQFSMQHVRFPNVFALGDGCSTPNAKTAAAVRQQAPVVAVNALALLDGKVLTAGYDGYGSCPLTVERGKIVLAEFGYGGKLMPTFPGWLIDGTQPSRLSWFLKEKLLPPIYWYAMLKGHEWLAAPKVLASVRPVQSA
jgi:sulfide:quinone oxidoreductase